MLFRSSAIGGAPVFEGAEHSLPNPLGEVRCARGRPPPVGAAENRVGVEHVDQVDAPQAPLLLRQPRHRRVHRPPLRLRQAVAQPGEGPQRHAQRLRHIGNTRTAPSQRHGLSTCATSATHRQRRIGDTVGACATSATRSAPAPRPQHGVPSAARCRRCCCCSLVASASSTSGLGVWPSLAHAHTTLASPCGSNLCTTADTCVTDQHNGPSQWGDFVLTWRSEAAARLGSTGGLQGVYRGSTGGLQAVISSSPGAPRQRPDWGLAGACASHLPPEPKSTPLNLRPNTQTQEVNTPNPQTLHSNPRGQHPQPSDPTLKPKPKRSTPNPQTPHRIPRSSWTAGVPPAPRERPSRAALRTSAA
eukprot:1195535-Prorocentrum_minimum.AAC.2